MTNREVSPHEILERATARWWLIVLFGILGGVVGWSLHFFHPPVFEATAGLTANIDFQQRKFTLDEEDRSYDAATTLAASSMMIAQVYKEAIARGLAVEQYPYELSLERKGSYWEFKVRDREPRIAAEAANIWVQVAYTALTQAQGHALHADQIQLEIAAIQNCFPVATQGAVSSSPSSCENYSLPALQNTVNDLSTQLLAERNASGGILSSMEFALMNQAVVPGNPVLYDQARLALAGTVIGLVVSLWVVAARSNARKHDGKS